MILSVAFTVSAPICSQTLSTAKRYFVDHQPLAQNGPKNLFSPAVLFPSQNGPELDSSPLNTGTYRQTNFSQFASPIYERANFFRASKDHCAIAQRTNEPMTMKLCK